MVDGMPEYNLLQNQMSGGFILAGLLMLVVGGLIPFLLPFLILNFSYHFQIIPKLKVRRDLFLHPVHLPSVESLLLMM